jgi:sugar phosphate isomerase/epimerase
MKRREFLQLGTGAVVGGVLVPAALSAHAQGGRGQAPAAAAPSGPVTKLKVDIYSRHLQWLRTPEEVADAALEMGYEGVNVTVRTYPGHINPEKVAQELPPFVKVLRDRGLLVRQITTNIADVDSPNAEAIIATASSLGITHFWWGTYRYEAGKPIFAQLDGFRPRVAKIAAMAEKYKMTASYHTYSMPNTVGSAMWDLLHLLREHDPKYVGFHYDTGHEAHHINGLWEVNMKSAGPYISAVAVKDYAPTQEAAGARGGGGRAGGGAAGGRAGGAPAAPAAPAVPAAPADPTLTGNNWRTRTVPLGAGMVNLTQVANVLKEIGFAGPLEIQAEYPNGGAESAQDKITLPRAEVLGAMKKDLVTLRRGFSPSGLL